MSDADKAAFLADTKISDLEEERDAWRDRYNEAQKGWDDTLATLETVIQERDALVAQLAEASRVRTQKDNQLFAMERQVGQSQHWKQLLQGDNLFKELEKTKEELQKTKKESIERGSQIRAAIRALSGDLD